MKTSHLCKTIISLTTLFLATSGHAQNSYVGISYSSIDFEEANESLDLDAISITLGNNFSEEFAGELRVGVGITDEDRFNTSIGIDTLVGAYGRVNFSNGGEITPYVIGGITQVEIEVEPSGLGTTTSDETDVSFGLGADFSLSDITKLNLEYMQYLDKNGAEIGGLNVGFSTRF